MNIRAAIFDTDGTLTESMYVWATTSSELVRSLGKTPKDDLNYTACRLSVIETAQLIKTDYDVDLSIEEIKEALISSVAQRYKNEVPIKDAYVREFLEELKSKGIPMCVATGTARPLIVSALERLDLMKYFKDVISTIDTGISKHQPDVYFKAAKLLGVENYGEIAVFEDARYAAKTAKDAGFYVTGIYSDFFREDWEEIKSFTDFNITSYKELLGKFDKA